MRISKFEKLVYDKLREVPRGSVTSYGDLARAIGKPGSARALGNALNKNPFAPEVPCHRVVRSDGSIGGFAGGAKKKLEILKEEGLKIESDKLNLSKYGYNFTKT